MASPRHRESHEFVQERTGEAYRAAFHYEGEEWEALYVREEYATAELRAVVPEVVDRLLERPVLIREEEYPPLGETEATTEVHDDAVVLHFPEGPDEGTIVSLDRDVARRLAGFVVRCTSILERPPGGGRWASAATD